MINYKSNAPPIDDITAKEYGLYDWQCYFRSIFHNNNMKIKSIGYRDNQVAFMRGFILSHISQDLGDLAEAIRESDEDRLQSKTAAILAWIFALANELETNIEEIVREKYPGFCPYCHLRKNCICPWWIPKQTQKNKDEKIPDKPADGESHTIPSQLTGWIDQWEIIYGRKYKIAMSKETIMYKLLEEEAEVLEELDKVNGKFLDTNADYYNKIKKEFADFISWFLALLYKMDTEKYLERKDLPVILYKKFLSGCPTCTKDKCDCIPCWLNETSKR